MSKLPRPPAPSAHRRAIEMVVFLTLSALGIYALGNGFNGLSRSGGAGDLVWLAVAGLAIMILCSQMGRVHDSWPRRGKVRRDLAQPGAAADSNVTPRPTKSGEDRSGV